MIVHCLHFIEYHWDTMVTTNQIASSIQNNKMNINHLRQMI